MSKQCGRCLSTKVPDEAIVCPQCQHGFGDRPVLDQTQLVAKLEARLAALEGSS